MGKIILTNQNKIKGKKSVKHPKYQFTKYEVTPRSAFDQSYVAFYEIPPMKESYPYHYHEANTEVFYIISGMGILTTSDGEFPVEKGDIFVCPPHEEGGHKLRNVSREESLVYLDVDTTNSPDVIHYPNSKKVGVIVHNVSSTFFEEGSKVDYYKGE